MLLICLNTPGDGWHQPTFLWVSPLIYYIHYCNKGTVSYPQVPRLLAYISNGNQIQTNSANLRRWIQFSRAPLTTCHLRTEEQKRSISQSLCVYMLHIMSSFMVFTGCYSQTKTMRLDLFHLTSSTDTSTRQSYSTGLRFRALVFVNTA